MNSVYLFDIEGTVAPISFVTDVLFPYSEKRLEMYLKSNLLEESFFQKISEEYRSDKDGALYSESLSNHPESVTKYMKFLISVDRKSPTLKEIQGNIWKEGYENGEIKSKLFPDTPEFFTYLKSKNIGIAIYSSGSILAQKLIFKYSEFGDLTGFIMDYFDTGIGGKREPGSYQNILKKLNIPSSRVKFFTDIKEEADASSPTGIKTYIMTRPGNKPQASHSYDVLEDFRSLMKID